MHPPTPQRHYVSLDVFLVPRAVAGFTPKEDPLIYGDVTWPGTAATLSTRTWLRTFWRPCSADTFDAVVAAGAPCVGASDVMEDWADLNLSMHLTVHAQGGALYGLARTHRTFTYVWRPEPWIPSRRCGYRLVDATTSGLLSWERVCDLAEARGCRQLAYLPAREVWRFQGPNATPLEVTAHLDPRWRRPLREPERRLRPLL